MLMPPDNEQKKRRKWSRPVFVLLLIVLALPLLYFGGGWVYSLVTSFRLQEWENTLTRDADGVRKGAQPFQVGTGATAVLLVHGFGDSPAIYWEVAREFANRGFTCRAMRLPGFGEPAKAFKGKDYMDWVAKLDREVEMLRQDGHPTWVVAHSLGAAVALRYAVDRQDLAGLVVLAPLVEVSGERSPLLPPKVWFQLLTSTLPWVETVENPFPRDLHRDAAEADPGTDMFFSVDVYRQLFRLIDDINRNSSKISCPLLMILSTDDEVVDSKAAEGFLRRTSARPQKLLLAEQSGHVIPMDQEWREVVGWIEEFIRANSVERD